MDPHEILTQTLLALIKEGIREGFSFVASATKDKRKAKEATDKADNKAQSIALKTATLDALAGKIPVGSEVDWNKVGTLFWLGNDLMWLQDMMHRGALPELVIQGIHNANQYIKDLGFGPKSLPSQQLNLSISILESLASMTEIGEREFAVILQHYGTVDRNIKTVKWYVDARVKEEQQDFEKLRAF